MKRLFDLVFATLTLLATLPFWGIIAVTIKLTSAGPILYRSPRIGRFGRPFHLYKFRTMHADCPPGGSKLTVHGDPRVTRFGRWLRRFRLDELPQLLNVLVGQMSLVGPRPEDPRFVQGYGSLAEVILSVRPGIASPAAIEYRNEVELLKDAEDTEAYYLREILPAKAEMDAGYVQERSLLRDVKILARAVWAVLTS